MCLAMVSTDAFTQLTKVFHKFASLGRFNDICRDGVASQTVREKVCNRNRGVTLDVADDCGKKSGDFFL